MTAIILSIILFCTRLLCILKVVFASALVLASADFAEFKDRYGKLYNSDDVQAAHQASCEANMQNVAKVNAQNLVFELGENRFSDLTQDQYCVAAGLGHKAPGSFNGMPHLGEHLHGGTELPAEKKWVTVNCWCRQSYQA